MKQHWNSYLKALENNKPPATSDPCPYLTSESKIGVSGFLDLKPARPEIQARYDAMSGSWQGIEASDKAVLKGLFTTDSMPLKQKK
jgi:hypothetical protein